MKLSDRVKQAIADQTKDIVIDFADYETWVRYLVMMHQIIIASDGLLMSAHSKAESSAHLDSGSKSLSEYYLSHFEEEKDHAGWLAEDIEHAGVVVSDIPLYHRIAEMVGSQYYLINHRSANLFLGYLAVLEGSPMPIERVEALEQLHGKELVRTVRHHAVHDVSHAQELYDIIDKTGDEQIIGNAAQVARYMNELAEFLKGI